MLWKSIFGLIAKKVEIVNIDDEHNSGESSSVLSLQENISRIHVDTPNTPKIKQSRLKNEEEDGEDREVNENDKIVLVP